MRRSAAYLEQTFSTFEAFRVEFHEIRESGEDLFVIGRLYARGRASGAEVDAPWISKWRIRDGKVQRMRGLLGTEAEWNAMGLELP
jgi:ketosteroid isomerase-like protein